MYRILIVDDMLVNRKLMKKVLKDSIDNVCFLDAEDGFQATEVLEKDDIDLVILDLMMPGKDGYEVLEEMKEHPSHVDIPVIVNSAVTDMESIKRTLEMGAMDYFTKPITPEQMKVIIPLKASNALKFYEQKKDLKEMNKRMKNELKIASLLQGALFRNRENQNKVKLYQKYLACDELGGDLFDYVENENHSWFMIADITGHGVAASMVASMLKVVFNHAILNNEKPKEVLEEINLTFYNLMEENTNLCFSVFVGKLEGDTVTYSNAGHPYPLLIKKRKEEWEFLAANGYLIGLFRDTKYDNHAITLLPGEGILNYTDGLFEDPKNPEESKSHTSVLKHAELLDGIALKKPDNFLEQLMTSFRKTNKSQLDDDIAIMYLIRK
ncbi:PP2C family protein-serine/threonine phosphatase [Tindallia californiensis]|uniref:Stage 0 sporulation protein A homolog n=1 Tax=Tindallia californiensis TaxID=159292 RepID=A0A1H3I4H3_9FIRM|nr:fused response regulator/phosphatase [Tindallia californiensis]SDY22522.1 sigma-B regulation protein RsbU (phosphoserine phosphatase) [Tindallia californiensis]